MIVRDQAMMPSVACSFCNLYLPDRFRMVEKSIPWACFQPDVQHISEKSRHSDEGPYVTQPIDPYLTGDLPGIGGQIRATPEDFQVDERPLYLPCGEGEHVYVTITKRNLSTPD